MPQEKIRFAVTKPGILGLDVFTPGGEWRRMADFSVEIYREKQPITWKWDDLILTKDGRTQWKAQSDDLSLVIEFSAHDDLMDISLNLKAETPKSMNCCLLNLDFLPDKLSAEQLDECHVPHLLPKPGLVIGDIVFRSPAIVLRRKSMAMALLPDLSKLPESRDAPWIMNFDRVGPRGVPRMSLGLMKYRPRGHVFFKGLPDETILIPDTGLTLSGHLMLSGEAGENYLRRVLRFLWERYGIPNYMAVKPQVLTLDKFAEEALGRLFKRDDMYFEFEYKGAKRGGVVAHTATSEKPLKPFGPLLTRALTYINGGFVHLTLSFMSLFGQSPEGDERLRRTVHKRGIPLIRQTWFQSWFNDLRTAYGTRIMADKWGDNRLAEQATRIKDLALSAPVEDGIFAAICHHPEGRVWWKKGSLTFLAINDYHTPDQATTGCMMLRWYRDIEKDPALLGMARGLGRFFIKHQLLSGAVPAWIKGRTHRHAKCLMESASTAGPMMFMALLAAVDKDDAALNSAKRMAEFIEKYVIPGHLWFDYETVFSCSRHQNRFHDNRTGLPPQNGMSMCWAAEGMRLLFEVTGEERYRQLLLKCLDDLLCLQQVWNASVLSINTFGGFASMNTDAEWNDARQGMIAPVLMDSYRATGDPHYFQRGVAALRASYTTMLHPALKEVAPGNMIHYRESDRGAVYENYSHGGHNRVIAGYLEPDWGAGTAAFATAHAAKFYGDVYVDLPRGNAFGINGCAVKRFDKEGDTARLEIESLVPDLHDWRVVMEGATPSTRLLVNGKEHPFKNI